MNHLASEAPYCKGSSRRMLNAKERRKTGERSHTRHLGLLGKDHAVDIGLGGARLP